MTKGDIYTKEIIKRILEEGTLDENPRPHYKDGTPAHTLSVNHGMCTYDLTKGESPFITIDPVPVRDGVGVVLWEYRDASNNIYDLEKKYGVRDFRKWMVNPHFYDEKGIRQEGHNPYEGYYYDSIGNKMNIGEKSPSLLDGDEDIKHNIIDSSTGDILTPKASIGACYGYTVRQHHLFTRLLDGLEKDPFGRRHIMDLWQVDDFKLNHGIKPCAFLTEWNVRKKDDTYYLDMCLTQGSGNIITAGCINQPQYMILLCMVAKHLGYTPGRFTWFYNNIQIYDRHIEAAKELLEREPIDCNPTVEIKKDDIYLMKQNDVIIKDYPIEEIKTKNKKLKLELGI